jgi:predicted enzyme related to lactoylglutathione lyase
MSKPSNFVWYELHTFDAAAAVDFYRHVIGWDAQDSGMPGKSYLLLKVGETPVAGLLQKPAAAFSNGAKPGWMGYIAVDDLDDATAKLLDAGGIVHRAAEDIPHVGRFAVVADPQGAIFVMMQPIGMTRTEQPPTGTPGTFAWHDLAAVEWQSDFDFYSSLFGWSKANALDMGPYGTYQIFAAGDVALGGMMNRMNKEQSPGWLYYVNVEDMDAALARALTGGGTITHGPSTVSTGQRIAHVVDPQGAMFGVVAPGE